MIEVRLFATFREGRDKVSLLESNQYHTTLEVLRYLNIPSDEVAICLINGKHSTLEEPIKAGDVLAIFPPVGGG
ncbi:MAG TPA: MoaD/ThiS family protein [Lachnospiraceae bacterium]|nr:MoaD/ThiS family protein [Lachnospiraceae bacterium]